MANKADIPTFADATNGPNSAVFLKAMELEMAIPIKMETFYVTTCTPKLKVIFPVWAFKVNHFHNWSVKKLKARLCVCGFKQVVGCDYFETFSPIVQSITICTILIKTILLSLENQQIDYTAAFVQAPIGTYVYVEMPQGFATSGEVWKLKKYIRPQTDPLELLPSHEG